MNTYRIRVNACGDAVYVQAQYEGEAVRFCRQMGLQVTTSELCTWVPYGNVWKANNPMVAALAETTHQLKLYSQENDHATRAIIDRNQSLLD